MHAPLRPAPITHPLTTHPPTHRSLHSPPRHSHAHTPLTTHHALHHPPRNSPKPYTLGHACPHPVMPALVTLSYSCMHARTTNTHSTYAHTPGARTHTHTMRSCLPPPGHACPHADMPAPTPAVICTCMHTRMLKRARTHPRPMHPRHTRRTHPRRMHPRPMHPSARTGGARTQGPHAHNTQTHTPRTTHIHTRTHTHHARTCTPRVRAHTHTHTHTRRANTHTCHLLAAGTEAPRVQSGSRPRPQHAASTW